MISPARTKQTLALLLAFASFAICQAANAQPDFVGQQGFGGFASAPEPDLVQVRAEFTVATQDQPARLFVFAEVADDWHIYSTTQPPGGPLKTQIQIDQQAQFRLSGPFQVVQPPVVHTYDEFWPNLPVEEHEGKVVWYAPIELAEGVDPNRLTITGKILGQVCKEMCLPFTLEFMASMGPGMAVTAGATSTAASQPLALIVVFALLGGLILNLMPCVLPVIGLKILGFVDQAGQSRGRVFALNAYYAIGMLSVFLLLATLATSVQLGIGTENLGWGEQFTFMWFKVATTALVFVMALSFLGVWDIPIPGFAGRGKASDLAAREGASGAFFKGIFTTILATPCSGPFLGPLFAYTIGQPPQVTYLIFASIGLGMASPYLLIGAFPRLIAFIPKPGAWMDTFKQLMGFLLLATAVYLLSTITNRYVVPTFAFLVALWFGCWWIGRIPITASLTKKLTAWCGSSLVAAVVGFLAFVPSQHELPWQPYSPETLADAQARGKTVLVDFTADWCLTCKLNLKMAINTKKVKRLVEKNNVITLIADWTDRSDMIKQSLAQLDSVSIPLLAVYPASQPGRPIVLRDLLFESDVVAALEKAGPSQPDEITSDAIAAPPSLTPVP